MVSVKEERWFYVALIVAIILQIICMSLDWTYAEYPLRFSKSKYINRLNLNSGYPFFGSEFKAGLAFCISGCNSTFDSEREDWCEISDHLKEVCPGCIEENYSLSLCKLFTNQYTIGVIFVVLSTLFMFFQFIYLFIGLIDPSCYSDPKSKSCKITILFLRSIIVVFLFMGWLLWLALGLTSSIVIGDDCKEFPTDGSVPGVCADVGVYFGFACLIYHSTVYFWGLSFKIRKYYSSIEEIPRLKVESQKEIHQEYPISEYAMKIVYDPQIKEDSENRNGESSVSDRPSSPEILNS